MNYAEVAKKNQILKVRVGSHLFGTDTTESDTDYEGIFMPNRELVYGFGKCREVDLGVVDKDDTGRNTKEAVDYKIREYRDFCRLALENNPNIMNVLFSDDKNTVFCNEFGDRLREKATLFPHKGCVRRYRGYAISQMKKMEIKPENYERLKCAKIFLEQQKPSDVMAVVVGATPNLDMIGIKDHGPGKHLQIGDIMVERGLFVKKAIERVSGRLERASSRANMWEEHGYDLKFASNLIQILIQGNELLTYGALTFPLRLAHLVLDIKRGIFRLDEIQDMADDLIADIEKSEGMSNLPAKPRYDEVEAFVMKEVREWMNR